MLSTRRSLLLILALLGTFLSAVSTDIAGEPSLGLKMEASPAFGGYLKHGEWLPVWLYLENSGSDLQAEVSVHVAESHGMASFVVPVSLPPDSRKRVPVYVLPGSSTRALEVELVDPQGTVLLSQRVQVSPLANVHYVAGLVARERRALSLVAEASIAGTTQPMVLIDVPLAEFPERPEGLGSFDCLILNDIDTVSLTPHQRSALETWVRQGGRLIIGGGAGARRTVSGLSAAILPLVPLRELEVNELPGLTDLGGGKDVHMPGPFLVSVGDLREGRTLAGQDDLPLVRERAVGSGRVDWVALDLAASPFDAWARLILSDAAYPQHIPPDISPRQMRYSQMSDMLSNTHSPRVPSVWGLSVLLGVYVLLVGPINYLVLRWRKALRWVWATIPAVTLLSMAVALALGYPVHSSDLVLNKIAIMDQQGDGRIHVDTYVGLFSPSQQVYEIEVMGGGLVSALNAGYQESLPPPGWGAPRGLQWCAMWWHWVC